MKTKFGMLLMTGIFAGHLGAGIVPADVSDLPALKATAANKNHLLLVNVGEAADNATWGAAVTYVAQLFQINVWTNSAASVSIPDLIADPDYCKKHFGEKAKVCVFLVDDANSRDYLAAPLCWSVVNVNWIKRDKPDAAKLRDRFARMIIKGMAFASAGGASIETRCSMHYDSFNPAGLDKTGVTLSPMTYFPMLEALKRVGGPAIVNQDEATGVE